VGNREGRRGRRLAAEREHGDPDPSTRERLGLPEQQIQKYEPTMYSGVSLDRLQDIADALEFEIEERVT
jgi:hypothetical protein